MARSRNIKPGFFKNEELAECSPWARLCFAGLWMLADREGRLEDRPKRIKGELFAFDNIDVDPLLAELEAHGFLLRYQNSDGSFIQISKFSEHQTPHYTEKQSTIKPPILQESDIDKYSKTPGVIQEYSKNTPGEGPSLRGGENPLIPDSGFLIPEKDSEAKASGAGSAKVLSVKDRVWALGITILGEGGRSHLAKLAKTHGDDVVLAALQAAADEEPVDPKSWLVRACEVSARKHAQAKPKGPLHELSEDPRPAWATQAGFPTRFDANNFGCYEHNAHQFRDGERIKEPT